MPKRPKRARETSTLRDGVGVVPRKVSVAHIGPGLGACPVRTPAESAQFTQRLGEAYSGYNPFTAAYSNPNSRETANGGLREALRISLSQTGALSPDNEGIQAPGRESVRYCVHAEISQSCLAQERLRSMPGKTATAPALEAKAKQPAVKTEPHSNVQQTRLPPRALGRKSRNPRRVFRGCRVPARGPSAG